ncbi:MAG: aminodeoxychorismate/anthranilate synthase component II [Gammaproteobacteria bacterium]|nr:aminodeoxychorismate/anthranilate synthase component II [Gammaproteobacteria bacterium]
MILMLDNYDSFTYNLVQYCGELGHEVEVVRNDAIDLAGIRQRAPSHIIVSPGPCTPNEAGISLSVVKELAPEFPILGVCLGHQCIGQAYGGKVIHARQVMHGKTSPIHHHGTGLFRDIPDQFIATRYHSLVIEKETCPPCLEITAWTTLESGAMDEIMGVQHRELPLFGVQFHPEAILTQHGHQLLRNFFDVTR